MSSNAGFSGFAQRRNSPIDDGPKMHDKKDEESRLREADRHLQGLEPPPRAPRAVREPEDDLDDFDGSNMYGEPPQETIADVLFSVGWGIFFRCVAIAQRAPLDRIQYLMQMRAEMIRQKKLVSRDDYNGILQTVKVCYKKQGLLGFWRGLALRCISMVPLIVISNMGNSTMPFFFHTSAPFIGELPAILWANAASYTIVAAAAHPVEVLQLRMACELCTDEDLDEVPANERVDGVFSFLSRVFRNDGKFAMWRGLGTSLCTAAAGNATFFLMADRIGTWFPSVFESPIKQGVVTFFLMTAANLVIYPMDTVRRRMMMTVGSDKKYRYKGVFDVLREIQQEPQGLIGGLYAGASFTLLRTAGAFAWGFLKMKLFE